MKGVSYNIQYGLGADNTYDLNRIAEEVRGADIIALQEVDRNWKRSGMVDTPAVLSDLIPDHHWVYGANLDMDASFVQDGRLRHRRKQMGNAIFSRWPILSTRNFPLPKWGDRRHHTMHQGMLEAVIDHPSGPLRVYSVHLNHLSSETRMPQVQAMLDAITRAPAEGGAWSGPQIDAISGWVEEAEPPMPAPAILMGDMNFTAASAEYARVVGPLSEGFGRLTSRAGFVDAWVEAGHDEGAGATHGWLGQRIDHCFVTAGLAGRVRGCWIDDTATGSDHWPVWVELDLQDPIKR